MSEIRAFIAISFPPEIYSRLDQVSRQLKGLLPGVPVRWVPVKNIHLTLKFLGNVSEGNLDVLRNVIEVESCRQSPFEISLGELGAFPSMNRPRVLWVGISAPQELKILARGIEREMERLGYPSEERPFSPHLTLGRVGRQINSSEIRQIGDVIQTTKLNFAEKTRVVEIHLYRSDLQPGGAIYTRLFSAPFAKLEQ